MGGSSLLDIVEIFWGISTSVGSQYSLAKMDTISRSSLQIEVERIIN